MGEKNVDPNEVVRRFAEAVTRMLDGVAPHDDMPKGYVDVCLTVKAAEDLVGKLALAGDGPREKIFWVAPLAEAAAHGFADLGFNALIMCSIEDGKVVTVPLAEWLAARGARAWWPRGVRAAAREVLRRPIHPSERDPASDVAFSLPVGAGGTRGPSMTVRAVIDQVDHVAAVLSAVRLLYLTPGLYDRIDFAVSGGAGVAVQNAIMPRVTIHPVGSGDREIRWNVYEAGTGFRAVPLRRHENPGLPTEPGSVVSLNAPEPKDNTVADVIHEIDAIEARTPATSPLTLPPGLYDFVRAVLMGRSTTHKDEKYETLATRAFISPAESDGGAMVWRTTQWPSVVRRRVMQRRVDRQEAESPVSVFDRTIQEVDEIIDAAVEKAPFTGEVFVPARTYDFIFAAVLRPDDPAEPRSAAITPEEGRLLGRVVAPGLSGTPLTWMFRGGSRRFILRRKDDAQQQDGGE